MHRIFDLIHRQQHPRWYKLLFPKPMPNKEALHNASAFLFQRFAYSQSYSAKRLIFLNFW